MPEPEVVSYGAQLRKMLFLDLKGGVLFVG